MDFKSKDLTIPDVRQLLVEQINEKFLAELRLANVELADTAVCRIEPRLIELGIEANEKDKEKGYRMEFASDVHIYCEFENRIGKQTNNINYGSSGAYTPENKASYWKAIHAASIMKNWDLVCVIVNKYCEMYREFEKEAVTQLS